MERKTLCAGSYDPITYGHLWKIKEASKLFDKVTVAVGVNPEKKCILSLEERAELIKKSISGLKNVEVSTFNKEYLFDIAKKIGAKYLVRAIRNEEDFIYERILRHVNSDLAPDLTTIILIPPRELTEISSTLVKGLIGYNNWENVIKNYVPTPVYEKLLEKFGGQK